jgi:hypothetical protein
MLNADDDAQQINTTWSLRLIPVQEVSHDTQFNIGNYVISSESDRVKSNKSNPTVNIIIRAILQRTAKSMVPYSIAQPLILTMI